MLTSQEGFVNVLDEEIDEIKLYFGLWEITVLNGDKSTLNLSGIFYQRDAFTIPDKVVQDLIEEDDKIYFEFRAWTSSSEPNPGDIIVENLWGNEWMDF